MKAFFVAFNTSLTTAQLGARRRKLAKLLREHKIDLQTLRAGDNVRRVVTRLVMEAKAAPVVAVDDRHPLPERAPWLADLTRDVIDLPLLRRPQLVYVTRRAGAAGSTQAQRHPVVRCYVKRDGQGQWVDDVLEAVLDLLEQLEAGEPPPTTTTPPTIPDVVGASPCFVEAVEQLDRIMHSSYGLVTGESGVGKMFLIRALWRRMRGNVRIIVLPCGSFFKDYYVAGSRRRFGGGREAVDQLRPYLEEAHGGLLVLHRVEQLPTALQEELTVRLPSSAGDPGTPTRLRGVDRDGLAEYDVRVIATSTSSPEMLRHTGRLIPDLVSKLRKRHVRIPTLAERGPEDMRLLCEDMLRRIAHRQGLATVARVGEAVVETLSKAAWPENLSDLVRVLEHALRRCRGGTLRVSHLPKNIATGAPGAGQPTLDEVVAQAQRTAIENALEQTGGNVARAAEILGRDKGTLYRLMDKLGMVRTQAKKERRGSGSQPKPTEYVDYAHTSSLPVREAVHRER